MQNKKKWVKNQQPIRYNNQKQVIDLMRSGSQSCSDIAKATGLSNTAAENIVDEMVEMGVLVKGPITDYGKLGRRPIKYKLNGELGVVVSVDLTDRDLLICISNMNRQILFRSEVKNIIMITEQILNDIVEIIKEGLQKPGISDKPLLCICFAIPGYFNKDTGEFLLANRIENCREVNIKSLFSEIFGCDILLQKDIISGVIGEMQFGVLSTLQAKNALFMHFDINIASAFIFDGKMYEGDHGFAGETGFILQHRAGTAALARNLEVDETVVAGFAERRGGFHPIDRVADIRQPVIVLHSEIVRNMQRLQRFSAVADEDVVRFGLREREMPGIETDAELRRTDPVDDPEQVGRRIGRLEFIIFAVHVFEADRDAELCGLFAEFPETLQRDCLRLLRRPPRRPRLSAA